MHQRMYPTLLTTLWDNHIQGKAGTLFNKETFLLAYHILGQCYFVHFYSLFCCFQVCSEKESLCNGYQQVTTYLNER